MLHVRMYTSDPLQVMAVLSKSDIDFRMVRWQR